MNKIDELKLYNTINYIAKAYKKIIGEYIPETTLYEILIKIDKTSTTDLGISVFGMDYIFTEDGLVPKKLYTQTNIKTNLFQFIGDTIKAKNKANLDYLSDYEIGIIDNVIDKYTKIGKKQEKGNNDENR